MDTEEDGAQRAASVLREVEIELLTLVAIGDVRDVEEGADAIGQGLGGGCRFFEGLCEDGLRQQEGEGKEAYHDAEMSFCLTRKSWMICLVLSFQPGVSLVKPWLPPGTVMNSTELPESVSFFTRSTDWR